MIKIMAIFTLIISPFSVIVQCKLVSENKITNKITNQGQINLIQDMLESYDRKAKPTWDNEKPINVTFSMDLYQILDLNEPQQYILLNAWIIERWYDEFLYWNPLDYNNISELRLPYDAIWMPDTTLYNSLVMKDEDTRRLLNAKLTTNTTRRAVLIDLLYPAIFKFSCLLTLRYFPYDLQVCTMTFSSWTHDKKGIDYYPYASMIGTSNFLENEGWYLLHTTVKRKEVKYSCCPNKYTLLKLTLYLRRKPLFYLINLIIPTSIITLIAIVGFFTTSSASGMREEKVSLGITTLLSMSILMLMVSDQMPTTSTFIPLIGWFILCMIILISMGTLASTIVIGVQKRGRLGDRLSPRAVRIARFFGSFSATDLPLHMRKEYKPSKIAMKNGLLQKGVPKMTNLITQSNENLKKNGLHLQSASPTISPSFVSRLIMFLCNSKHRYTSKKSVEPLISEEVDGHKKLRKPNLIDQNTFIKMKNTKANKSYVPNTEPSQVFDKTAFSLLPNTQRHNSDNQSITSLIATNLVTPSATAVPSNIKRLSLHTVFDEENTNKEDAFINPNAEEHLPVSPLDTFTTAVLFSNPSIPANDSLQRSRTINGSLRQNRLFAQREYEWLATVLEHCCFIVFVILFFVLTIGINLIGYWHWADVQSALKREGDERHS